MKREQKRKKKRVKAVMTVFLVLVSVIAAAVLIVWNVFVVKKVVVEGNEFYSAQQIERMVLDDEYSWNSLYVYLKYRLLDEEDVPFVDMLTVTLDDPRTLRIHVYEKGILGSFYISSIGQNAYFDRDGFVVETSVEEIADVPRITGISCDEVVLYEKLPLREAGVLGGLLNLTQTLKKYELLPEEIHYEDNLEPTLSYGDIRVTMGALGHLPQKVARISAVLPQISGMIGTLHMETWTPDTTDIVFERAKTESTPSGEESPDGTEEPRGEGDPSGEGGVEMPRGEGEPGGEGEPETPRGEGDPGAEGEPEMPREAEEPQEAGESDAADTPGDGESF